MNNIYFPSQYLAKIAAAQEQVQPEEIEDLPEVPETPEGNRIDALSAITTGAGAVGGGVAGAKIGKDIGPGIALRNKNYKLRLADLEKDPRVGNFLYSRRPKLYNQYVKLQDQLVNGQVKGPQLRVLKQRINNLEKTIGVQEKLLTDKLRTKFTGRVRAAGAKTGKVIGGTAGAVTLASIMYGLTNPQARAKFAKVLDKKD